MDKGAHFYRCDFQVHTPRDINWKGERPTTESERKKYAEEFIKACRKRGLDAVAITDHHDVAFFPFIKNAAENEIDENEKPVPLKNRIIVFPGMELTLVPIQALLILSSDFSVDLYQNLPTILQISENSASAPTHAEVEPLDHIKTLPELYKRLDNTDYLKGKYIVLPHVQEKGHKTIFRNGLAPLYKEMPCVGGYLDGPITNLSIGKKNIIDGKHEDYGFKALGVFQTSDCRNRSFDELGTHSSWVKWSNPTAEALRQACLARHTRITHEEPLIPSVVIQGLEVSNSKFMGPLNLNLNPQLNCIIGGRGTGKSTILEYMRWVLCDQPPRATDEDEGIPDYEKNRSRLIQNTLAPLNSDVTIHFLLNEVPHSVKRQANDGQVFLRINNGEFQEQSEEDIRKLLPIRSYSQKQLSGVGDRSDELYRLVRGPIVKNLNDLQQKGNESKEQLRALYGKINSKRILKKQLKNERLELHSLNQQASQLRKGLTGLTKNDQEIIKKHELIEEEKRLVGVYDQGIKALLEIIQSTQTEFSLLTRGTKIDDNLPNKDSILKLKEKYNKMLQLAEETLASLSKKLTKQGELPREYTKLHQEWQNKINNHNKAYEAAKSKATSHKDKLDQISKLEKRIQELTKLITKKEQSLSSLGNPETKYQETRKNWLSSFSKRGDLLESECKRLTRESDNFIKATLNRGAELKNVSIEFKEITKGTRIRETKWEELLNNIRSNVSPTKKWVELLDELEKIAQIEDTEASRIDLSQLPILDANSFNENELNKLSQKLSIDQWLELSLVELEDEIKFEYQQKKDEFILFSDASAGQQATALLKVLLNQDGPPLIIDQPEEDLDNEVIREIIEDIWLAKNKRQIIFTSHNANIVVNGDADLVIVCSYKTEGDQSGGKIRTSGAIDQPEIKELITSIMEGGREAFQLRKDKYGY